MAKVFCAKFAAILVKEAEFGCFAKCSTGVLVSGLGFRVLLVAEVDPIPRPPRGSKKWNPLIIP